MAHPTRGGSGSGFTAKHSFAKAYSFIGSEGHAFLSTTGEKIIARQGFARDRKTPTIVFIGKRNRHGSACPKCRGFESIATSQESASAPRLWITWSDTRESFFNAGSGHSVNKTRTSRPGARSAPWELRLNVIRVHQCSSVAQKSLRRARRRLHSGQCEALFTPRRLIRTFSSASMSR